MKKLFKILFTALILCGCSSSNQYILNDSLTMKSVDYDTIIISEDRNFPSTNTISLYKENQKIEELSFKTNSDIDYRKIIDNKIYMYNSGLFSFDFNTLELNQLSSKYISAFTIAGNNVYTFENVGFVDDENYMGRVYKNEELLFEVNGVISDLIVYNDLLYFCLDTINEGIFLSVFDGDSIRDLKEIKIDGYFSIINDNLYLIGKTSYLKIDDEIHVKGVPFKLGTTKIFEGNGKYYACVSSTLYLPDSGAIYEITEENDFLKFTLLYEFDFYGRFENNLLSNNIIYITKENYYIFDCDSKMIDIKPNEFKYSMYYGILK